MHTVIFDLDGTLIDSAPSILRSIEVAFEKVGVDPTKALTQDLIGPSLKDIFMNLVREEDKEKIHQLIEAFKQYYDLMGYKETRVYEAVAEMLEELLINGLKLHIATNKRLDPTLKIIKKLDWNKKFEKIYTLDYFNPALEEKREMLKKICEDLSLYDKGAIYLGDRLEDMEAAEEAGIYFIFADWGYDDKQLIPENTNRIKCPSLLFSEIKNFKKII